MKTLAFLLMCLVGFSQAADPHNTRVHDHDLSDEEHFPDGEHNPTYDQEAFTGEDSKEFKDLPPEDAKEKLRKLLIKVDTDGNGRVTRTEMTAWLTKSMKSYLYDDLDQQWKNVNTDGNEVITWTEYKNATYGYVDSSEDESYQSIIDRDQRRFKRADKSNDEKLSREEFLFFLHPEESKDMHDIVVDETMEDLDKDKDGFLSMEEYIGDVSKEEDGSEPEWVASEREQFTTYRDADKDGRLDKEEVTKWVVPPENDHAEEETNHLFTQADADKDDELSVEEIINKHDVFVGSQATNYGSMLHEEL